MHLGRLGIASAQLRFGEPGECREAAAELEELGFNALWIPGVVGGGIFGDSERLLEATKRTVVATGIVNIWMHSPEETAAAHRQLNSDHQGRFLLGLGVSHAPLVAASDQQYERPLAKTCEYLDQLDSGSVSVPKEERILAALGPKMLTLAKDRTVGTHPSMVSPAHTSFAREVMGEGPIIAVKQRVILETDPDVARAAARELLAGYSRFTNYTNNFLRTGFDEEDLAHGGSDRLVDGLFAWGDIEAVTRRVAEHREAGADHVCLQILPDPAFVADPKGLPREKWRQLAEAFLPN